MGSWMGYRVTECLLAAEVSLEARSMDPDEIIEALSEERTVAAEQEERVDSP